MSGGGKDRPGGLSDEVRKRIAELVSASHRKHLGRGPDKIRVSAVGDLIIVEAEGLLTPLEANAARLETGPRRVEALRADMLRMVIPEWQEAFREHFGLEISLTGEALDVGANKGTLTFKVA